MVTRITQADADQIVVEMTALLNDTERAGWLDEGLDIHLERMAQFYSFKAEAAKGVDRINEYNLLFSAFERLRESLNNARSAQAARDAKTKSKETQTHREELQKSML